MISQIRSRILKNIQIIDQVSMLRPNIQLFQGLRNQKSYQNSKLEYKAFDRSFSQQSMNQRPRYNRLDVDLDFVSENQESDQQRQFKRCFMENQETDKDIAGRLKENNIKVQKGNTDYKIGLVEELDQIQKLLPDYFCNNWNSNKFQDPTMVQQTSWDILLKGMNMIGVSKTGSGKTLAYLVPLLVQLQNQKRVKMKSGPLGLVIAPTRELVEQIFMVAKEFSYKSGLKICKITGGQKNRHIQERNLLFGCDIAICTPGRLIDFMQCQKINMHKVQYLVMDEADKMMEMGFEQQLREIVQQIRPDRHTCMFSATWPIEVQEFVDDYIDDYVYLQVGQDKLTFNENITQIIDKVDENDKGVRTIEYIQHMKSKNEKFKIIIFLNQKRRCDDMQMYLEDNGIDSCVIHGDMQHLDRQSTIRSFKGGRDNIMIATDIAARGLDISDVNLVMNVDMPLNATDYVHRIGRTGRGNKKGISVSFYSGKESVKFQKEFNQLLRKSKIQIPSFMTSNAIRDSSYNSNTNEQINKKCIEMLDQALLDL